jgi:hypothetical protein
MADKSQKNKSNDIVIPSLLFTGLAIYGINKVLIPYLAQSKGQTHQLPVIPAASDFSTGEHTVIEKTIVIHDNDNPTPPHSEDDNNSDSEPTPEPDPIPDKKNTSADNSNPIAGMLGNLFTQVIDKISPSANQQFYFSEQDVINNERIMIRHMKKANKGLCKIYTKWPAIKMKEIKTSKLYY